MQTPGEVQLATPTTKTKLVAFARFAKTNARSRGAQRPETILFLGFTLYCTQNQKGNFRVGAADRKSRFRRSLARLRELMRMQRHLPIPDQAGTSTGRYAVIMPTTALPGTSEQCNGYIGPWSATGTECCAAGAAKATSHGMCSTRSRHGLRLCDRSVFSLREATVYRCAVNQLPKSVVREICTLRSVGAGGGRPPPATRPSW